MSSLNDATFKLGAITPISTSDHNADSSVQEFRPGGYSWAVDMYGLKLMKYCQFHGGMSYAETAAEPVLVAVANITSGTTTSFVTTGLTADVHVGKMAYVVDAGVIASAVLPPEGQTSFVAANTTTVVTLEPGYPYSAALVANADIELISTYQTEDCADGDLAHEVQGVVMALDGVADTNFGWVVTQGVTPTLTVSSEAEAIAQPLVAAAARMGADGSDGIELWLGTCLVTVNADGTGNEKPPVNVGLLGTVGDAAP